VLRVQISLLSKLFKGLMFLQNYFSVFVFFFTSVALSSVVLVLSYFLSAKSGDPEKLSSYECGFSAFQDSRGEFDVRFYIVAMLFIIFDIEISFLFPFAVSFDSVSTAGLTSMLFFLVILSVGFFYEWKTGALDWV
jgi:NADH-quinone oxidoreductase subunit A